MDAIFYDIILFFTVILSPTQVLAIGEVVYAVNCGGPAHTDLSGVHYQADRLATGTASDYGKMLTINRVAPSDQILYQTERYHLSNFGYNIPIRDEGEYVLVLKFCEVYFQGPRLKVFDVAVNHLTVLRGLDIYDKVGRGVAHDEYIPFRISNGELHIADDVTPISQNLYVEFIKGYYDNPKVNAILVMKGKPDVVPKLPPLPGTPEEEEEEKEEAEEVNDSIKKTKKPRKTSGPKATDPYVGDEGSMLFPLCIAIGVFLPTLFCLCKL